MTNSIPFRIRYAAAGTAGNTFSWSEAMRIDSSGNVGIGTSSPTRLLDVNGIAKASIFDAGGEGFIRGDAAGELRIQSGTTATTFRNNSNNAEFMRIDSSGNVGIGTSSPDDELHIKGVTPAIKIEDTDGSYALISANADNLILGADEGNVGASSLIGFNVDGTERMRIDSSGNVGIGTSSPAAQLHLFGDNGDGLRIDRNNTGAVGNQIAFRHSNAGTLTETASINAISTANADTGTLVFYTKASGGSNTERMRLDSSGHLLVGTTSVQDPLSTTTNGHTLYGGGINVAIHSRNNDNPLAVQRTGNDGEIINFFKDTAQVGSIGTNGNSLYIDGGSSNYSVMLASDFRPRTSNGAANNDGNIDLGDSGARWKDLYLSGGVYLGGTGAANQLDDYEEGTWTPVVSGTTTSGSASYSIQSATYTKIGRLVYWSARVGYTGHTGTGNMTITGLPFTSSSRYASAEYSYRDGLTVPASEDLKVYVPPNVSYVGFYSVALGTDAVAALSLDTNVTDVSISGVYETT